MMTTLEWIGYGAMMLVAVIIYLGWSDTRR